MQIHGSQTLRLDERKVTGLQRTMQKGIQKAGAFLDWEFEAGSLELVFDLPPTFLSRILDYGRTSNLHAR